MHGTPICRCGKGRCQRAHGIHMLIQKKMRPYSEPSIAGSMSMGYGILLHDALEHGATITFLVHTRHGHGQWQVVQLSHTYMHSIRKSITQQEKGDSERKAALAHERVRIFLSGNTPSFLGKVVRKERQHFCLVAVSDRTTPYRAKRMSLFQRQVKQGALHRINIVASREC